MSQQMHFDEEQRGYTGSYTPTLGENIESYDRHSAQMPGQKLGMIYTGGEKSASPGQRLALAIVSMLVLIGGLGMLTSGDNFSTLLMIAKLIGLVAVCVTVILINLAFSGRRSI